MIITSNLPRSRAYSGREAGFWFVIFGLLLSCFAGHWRNIGVPIPIDRLLLLIGLAVEWDRARRENRLPRITTSAVLLVAAAAWAALSFIGSPIRTSVGFYLLADLYIMPTILFVSAPIVFGTRRRRFALAASFAVFGIYLGVTAITQRLDIPALVFPAYILDPTVGLHAGRARGPYVEAVNNGIMLVYCGVLSMFVAHAATSRWWRIIGTVGAVLCALGSALTLTRAVWIAATAVFVLALVVIPTLRRRIPLVLLLLTASSVLFLAVFPDFVTSATARTDDKSPIYDRLNVAQGALSMVWQNPLFGVGWDQAGPRMSEFVRLGTDYPVTAASANLIPHNVFLGRLAELGILGAVLWIAALIAAAILPIFRSGRYSVRPWRAVLLAFVLAWLIVANFGPMNYSEPVYLLYLVGGIAASGRLFTAAPWNWFPEDASRSRRSGRHNTDRRDG